MVRITPAMRRALIVLILFAFVTLNGLSTALAAASTPDTYNPGTPEILLQENLLADAAVLMDAKSGRVLFDKGANDKIYPASTTKVMTLLLALEFGNLDKQYTIPKEAADIPKDSSVVPIVVGDKIIFRDLLYGLMLRSGNDAANAVAVIVAGSVDEFVDMMNERALEIGCKNTHFVNPHGYHDANHYSTPYDIALIAREGMKNQEYRKIVGSRTYTMPKTQMAEATTISNSNSLLLTTSDYYYPAAIGIKTGYHKAAAYCLVAEASVNSKELIAAVMHSAEKGRYIDAKRMFDYGYTKYKQYTFNELYNRAPFSVTIRNSNPNDSAGGVLRLDPVPGETSDFSMMCLEDEIATAVSEFSSMLTIELTREPVAPVQTGDILGTLTLHQDNGIDLRTSLIASRDVQVAPEPFSLGKYIPALSSVNTSLIQLIGLIVLALVALVVGLRIRRNIRRNRRRKEALRRRNAAYNRNRTRR